MNEMKNLENRLRSWRPRPPAARLERRLFAAHSNALAKMTWLVGSLVPATACLLLTMAVFNSPNSGNSLRHEPLFAMILSNQNYAAYASGNFHESQNNLSRVTFEWTNRSVLPSSMAPF